jgi:hypothetical protein
MAYVTVDTDIHRFLSKVKLLMKLGKKYCYEMAFSVPEKGVLILQPETA